jgi:hypothetical protein
MPSARTLYKWAALFPDFAATVADAYDFRAWMAADRRMAESPIYAELLREMTARMDAGGA